MTDEPSKLDISDEMIAERRGGSGKMPDDMPSSFTAFSDNDDSIAHLVDKPVSSGIEDTSTRKYKEDESIEALKNYISTTLHFLNYDFSSSIFKIVALIASSNQ